MPRRHGFAFLLLHLVARPVFSAEPDAAPLRIDDLRCEHLANPLGIDDVRPRLSWKLVAAREDVRGKSQSAYHVLVASKRSLLDQNQGDLWDSGQVASDQSHLVPYKGKPLPSRSDCWWKVRVWDEDGDATAWSPVAHWSMGLLDQKAWLDAKWIGLSEKEDPGVATSDVRKAQWLWYPEGNAAVDAPVDTRYFRRRIVLPDDRRVTKAWCFFAGDDAVTFYVNGAHIGVGRGHPALVGADITGKLRAGANELAVANTNGAADVPANPAGWIGAVRVEFDRGEPLVFYSDSNWRSSRSVVEGWQVANFGGEDWVAAMELGKAGINPWGFPWKDHWQSEHRRLAGRYVRRDFEIKPHKQVQRATAYVCGLGFFDLHINGERIGDSLMNPALTGYDRRATLCHLRHH